MAGPESRSRAGAPREAHARGARAGRATTRIRCISGPNLQLLGTREPDVYGRETLAEIHTRLTKRALSLGVEIDARQTNHEGVLVDWIGESPKAGVSGLIINPGAYTHTSI